MQVRRVRAPRARVELPDHGIATFGSLIQPIPDKLVEDVRKAAQQQVDESSRHVATFPATPISVDARAGRPGEVLCDAASSADLWSSATAAWLADQQGARFGGTAQRSQRRVHSGCGPPGVLGRQRAEPTPVGAPSTSWAGDANRAEHDADRAEPDAGDSAGATVLAYLGEQADRLRRFDPLVRRDAPDSVHQMRVASRRLRSALQAYRRGWTATPPGR